MTNEINCFVHDTVMYKKGINIKDIMKLYNNSLLEPSFILYIIENKVVKPLKFKAKDCVFYNYEYIEEHNPELLI